MKRQPTVRENGLQIPGLTDEILKRLPPPYALIAAWSHYVPLKHLLNTHWATLSLFTDNDDGTVTLKWRGVKRIAQDYIIPLHLHRQTMEWVKSTFHVRLKLVEAGVLRKSTIFFSTHGPIQGQEFAAAALACARRLGFSR